MADTLRIPGLESVLAALDNREIIDFTQKLVRIPSVNKEHNEAEAVAIIAETSEKAGLRVSIREVQKGRPNILTVLHGESDEIGILFHGHTDTIPFFDMPDPVSGKIEDNYIWGRGSVDQKGGLAASVMATLAIARSGVPLKKSVAVAAVIDEESEHRGSAALVEDSLKAECAIVTEPSDLHLLVAHKGTAAIGIEFFGVQAHGSNPWLGVSAIEMAAKTVPALKEVELKTVSVPGVGTMRASFNIGVIRGGTQYNNVADSCRIFLDRRTVPGETFSEALAEVRQLLSRLAAEDPDFKAEAFIARPDWKWDFIMKRGLNPSMTSPESPVSRALITAHKAVTGEDVTINYTHGYNDGDFLVNDLGIPTVNYGPGEGRFSHTNEERLLIDHLLKATRVYALAALKMAGK